MHFPSVTTPADQFSVARIASVLGRDARELRRSLASREPDGQCLVSGNLTRTYLVSSLPESVQVALGQLAARLGFDCAERLLAREGARWEHGVPIAEMHPEEIARAQKRASALGAWVRAFSEGSRPAAEVQELALAAHGQVLGFKISPDTLRNFMHRVVQRDGGRGEFDRWELYLPESPKRRTQNAAAKAGSGFEQFEVYLAGIDAAAPTLEDRAWAWTAMCDNLQLLLEAGENPRAARCRLVRHAFARAPWLCRSKQSLSKCFDEKWRRYCAGERFLADRRPEKSGNAKARPLTEDDEKKLIALALGGGVSQAWRQLHARAALSSETIQRYAGSCTSKSYVPQIVRDIVAPKVEMAKPSHHGPREAKLKGAYITRNWDAVAVGDWYQGDDCTLPVYYWEIGPDGTPRAVRGQCLVMIDCRSLRGLAFALHSENNYNARVIRGLVLTTHDTYGLPRRGFYFERGMWKSSRLVTGGERTGDALSTAETEAGLRDFGVEFIHARLPRSKVVERVLGILQTRMEHEPGYCGRNEQVEKFERLRHNLQLARAGQIGYERFLLHRDEWARRIGEILDEYNCEPQDGQMLHGASPREFWEGRFDFNKPLVQLSAGLRYLLANHRRPLQVTRNGITVTLGKERHVFRSEATGPLQKRTVQVYFNPEDMSSIWMRSTVDSCEAIVVPRAPSPPAIGASPEELAAAMASCAAHNRAATTLYAAVSSHFPRNARPYFRDNIAAPAVVEQGREIGALQEEIRVAQVDQKQKRNQLAAYSRRLGHLPGSEAVSEDRRLKSLRLIEEAMKDV